MDTFVDEYFTWSLSNNNKWSGLNWLSSKKDPSGKCEKSNWSSMMKYYYLGGMDNEFN